MNYEKLFKELQPHLIFIGGLLIGGLLFTILTWNIRSANIDNWENVRCEIQEKR